jgi:hypothetical protein
MKKEILAKKNKPILPPELARKISPWMVNSAEITGAVGKSAVVGLAAFFLYGGPVSITKPDHSGFVYLLGPWVCPSLIALFFSALFAKRHFRVYRGSPFSDHSDVDKGDPAVMRLVALFNSDEIRRHLWHESLKLSCILFAIMGTAAILLRDSLYWTLPSPENQFLLNRRAGEPGFSFWLGLLGCSMFTVVVLGSDYIRWGLTTWANRESSRDPAK